MLVDLSLRAGSLSVLFAEYLGGGSRRAKRAGEINGTRQSEPARKPLNFEFSAFVHERGILIGLK